MAEVIPFTGIVYDPEKIRDLAEVVTPPYDVISEEEQEAFYARHPRNIIRLTLGKRFPEDTPVDNPHTRAAAHLKQWIAEGTLIEDRQDAFYLTTTDFAMESGPARRHGLIARVRLESFETGLVRPHEKTFSKVKSERFSLLKQCHINDSPIFSVFPDEDGQVLRTFQAQTEAGVPDTVFTEGQGALHRLWRITDRAVQRQIMDAFSDKVLFIADGHHRYETSLAYLQWIAGLQAPLPSDHPARYVMMYLSSMVDPGLIILPAHRILTRVAQGTVQRFWQEAPRYFEMETIAFSPGSRQEAERRLLARLNGNTTGTAMGVVVKDPAAFHFIRLKPGTMERLYGNTLAESLRRLDVTVLKHLVFTDLLGLGAKDLDDETLLTYDHDAHKVIERVLGGKAALGFIINPTRIEDVLRIAEAGLIMPRKSTYFYPKVTTGLVLNKLTQ